MALSGASQSVFGRGVVRGRDEWGDANGATWSWAELPRSNRTLRPVG
jgi:hypothetical protein